MSGTQLGATNYLLKIPVYFLVNTLHFLTPMNRILLAAVVFNVATFILLFMLYEKIMDLYRVKHRLWLYLAMAWLATIAGNVFWVDYANSRNLETVGGVLFIYLALKYLKQKHQATLMALAITGSIVFFADPIQLYVCGAGVGFFVIGRWLLRPTKSNMTQALAVTVVTALGYLGSQGLLLLARKFLHVTFLVVAVTQPALTPSNLVDTLHGVAASTLKIFGADFLKRPYGINSIRELLNALVLIFVVGLLFKLLLKTSKRTAYGLVLVVIATNYLVYIASGQVLQWETSRYLIMVPLLAIILIALGSDELGGRHKLKLQSAWLLIIVASSVMLVGAVAHSWPSRHSKDGHIGALISFMQQHNFRYGLSSRDAGITTTYFGQGKVIVLPMSCAADHTLQPTNLFYDKAAFKELLSYNDEVPIILQTDGIRFGANVCTRNDVIAQFGTPKRELAIPGVGSAVIYEVSRLRPAAPHTTREPQTSSTLTKLAGCKNGTVDVVAAHPDDDILFMNPDLTNQLANKCVRSVFVTAADDGRSPEYWKDRQLGIEAAYASIIGVPNVWTDDMAVVDGHPVLARTLNGHPAVGLVFLLLPDGGVGGGGFVQTGYVSLDKLSSNRNLSIPTVDGSSRYSYAELAKLVGTIIANDKPDIIFTHLSNGQLSVGDHSDHRAVGRLTMQARALAKSTAQVSRYVGYPINSLPPNLSLGATIQKGNTFYIYAYEDSAICSPTNACSVGVTYKKYFSRSYKIDQYQHYIAVKKTVPTPALPKQITISDLFRNPR